LDAGWPVSAARPGERLSEGAVLAQKGHLAALPEGCRADRRRRQDAAVARGSMPYLLRR